MQEGQILVELLKIVENRRFEQASATLVQAWISDGVGVESFAPVLRFMEEYPHLDFGAPGPLVHFIERVAGNGEEQDAEYERELAASIERKPTPHTAWLLNRLINSLDGPKKQFYTDLLQRSLSNPNADADTVQVIHEFLE